jgi:hypothetical protein
MLARQVSTRNSDGSRELVPVSKKLDDFVKELLSEVRSGMEVHQPIATDVLDCTGGVYFMRDSYGAKVAVFKPSDEEQGMPNNPKNHSGNGEHGLRPFYKPGSGHFRETAAYIIDQGNFCAVPPTAVVRCKHPIFHYPRAHGGQRKLFLKTGSLQEFVRTSTDSFDDISPSLISAFELQKIALLDLRILNSDRNSSNILLIPKPLSMQPVATGSGRRSSRTGSMGSNHSEHDNTDDCVEFVDDGTTNTTTGYSYSAAVLGVGNSWANSKDRYELVPIDHGYCFPTKLRIEDIDWSWMYTSQISKPVEPEIREYVRSLDIDKILSELKEQVELPPESYFLLKVAHKVVVEGIAAGLTLRQIAELIARVEDGKESPLERLLDLAEDNAFQYIASKLEKDPRKQQDTAEKFLKNSKDIDSRGMSPSLVPIATPPRLQQSEKPTSRKSRGNGAAALSLESRGSQHSALKGLGVIALYATAGTLASGQTNTSNSPISQVIVSSSTTPGVIQDFPTSARSILFNSASAAGDNEEVAVSKQQFSPLRVQSEMSLEYMSPAGRGLEAMSPIASVKTKASQSVLPPSSGQDFFFDEVDQDYLGENEKESAAAKPYRSDDVSHNDSGFAMDTGFNNSSNVLSLLNSSGMAGKPLVPIQTIDNSYLLVAGSSHSSGKSLVSLEGANGSMNNLAISPVTAPSSTQVSYLETFRLQMEQRLSDAVADPGPSSQQIQSSAGFPKQFIVAELPAIPLDNEKPAIVSSSSDDHNLDGVTSTEGSSSSSCLPESPASPSSSNAATRASFVLNSFGKPPRRHVTSFSPVSLSTVLLTDTKGSTGVSSSCKEPSIHPRNGASTDNGEVSDINKSCIAEISSRSLAIRAGSITSTSDNCSTDNDHPDDFFEALSCIDEDFSGIMSNASGDQLNQTLPIGGGLLKQPGEDLMPPPITFNRATSFASFYHHVSRSGLNSEPHRALRRKKQIIADQYPQELLKAKEYFTFNAVSSMISKAKLSVNSNL